MFEYINGRLAAKRGSNVVIDVNGVGYMISVPMSTIRALPEVGAQAKVLTYFHVTEKGQQLFGFGTAAERDIFTNLISISGVGPKLALTVLSGVSTEQFSDLLASDDAAMLTTIPGIGKKTAARIIVELRSKLPQLTRAEAEPAVPEEVILALESLGYSRYETRKVIDRLSTKLGRENLSKLSAEELIKEALQA
jgi:Holliday junction DNA helicase RuvA